MASATAIPPYSNNSPMYLVPVCILGAIALALVVLRIWTRLTRTRTLYIDDWLILVAEPLSLIDIFLACAAIAHGWGKPMAYFSPSDLVTTLKLEFALQTVWIFTLCFVRLSVAASLLRFGQDLWWRCTLYTIIVLQSLISASYVVIQFGQCRPISYNWESVGDVKCWNLNAIINYGWAIAGVYVAMDLILSLMPIHIIRSLSRSTAEKILVGFLMSLGLLATTIMAVKMTTFKSFGKGDPMQATMKPSVYAKLEEIIGIIACSLPCLKQPAERVLRNFGLVKDHQLTTPSFVNAVPLPDLAPKEAESMSSGEDSLPSGKEAVRIDSVAVKPGSSNSNPLEQLKRNENWNAV